MVGERTSIVPVSGSFVPRARLIVERALRDTAYLGGALDALRTAVDAPGADGRALACLRDERIEGVIVFGFFAGANGAGRLQLAVVEEGSRRAQVGRMLAEEAFALLRAEGARFVLAELPEDERALPGARAFLEALEFRLESRVEDFFRDGVALTFMRRDCDTG
jgi:ribosomal protein S18 acetylase RimI-like enzyme